MKTLITIIILICLISISCEKDIKKVRSRSTITMEPIELSPSKQSVDTLYPVCVIADFQDSKLEDMIFGLNSVEEVLEILHAIDKHWVWMSNGYQSLQWKLIRITIDKTYSASSYDSWYTYRQDVVRKSLLQLEVSEHNKNNDNIVDIMFIIASNKGKELDYLIGGSAEVSDGSFGANTFVDGQNSLSLQSKAIGNFSHEIGHNLGLPDIYGTYDNVQFLTIMADSWPVPPHTFSAYEKYKLGWAKPQIINETQLDINLESGETSLCFLKILTNNPLEYFLIEYRKRQISSYTSLAPTDYDGISIYHISNKTHNNAVFPPHLAIVPADGKDYFTGHKLAKTAFWYPGNELMPDTCSLKKYDGENCDFILTDFKYTEKGMSLSVIFE